MDENYLDSLLNEISLDNEIENNDAEALGGGRDRRVELKQDTFDDMISEDSNTAMHAGDDILGSGQFDELDELDRLADFDMSDLNFDDLDFDDLDMTDTKKNDRGVKQSAKPSKYKEKEVVPDIDFSDLAIDDMFFPGGKEEIVMSDVVIPENIPQAVTSEESPIEMDAFGSNTSETSPNTFEQELPTPETTESMDDMDALSALLGGDMFESEDNQTASSNDSVPVEADFSSLMESEETKSESKVATSDNEDINDLFAMLGIQESDLEDTPEKSMDSDSLGSGDLDGIDFGQLFGEEPDSQSEEQQSDLSSDDINSILNATIAEADSEIPQEKKQSFLATLLFGDDDEEEEEISEEELAAIKAEKKAKKDAKKAEKKAKSEEKKAAKDAKNAAAQSEKAAKAAVKAAKLKAELAAMPPEKKLNKKLVTLIMGFFLVLAAIVVLGTQTVNYTIVIKKAADYFERHKYQLAYDEIVGVEVKEEDQELEDRIYTVMYVERLYQSYENNMALKRRDRALDALLRGLTKYDEHYQEAIELGILNDIDICRRKIVDALSKTYQMSVEDAYKILALDSYSYREKMAEYATPIPDDHKIVITTTEESKE